MPFAYYDKLSERQKRVYRRSDEIHSVAIADVAALSGVVAGLRTALEAEDQRQTQALCQALIDALAAQLGAPPLRITVYAKRPSHDWGELHGLYEPAEGTQRAHISVWMRTAQRKQVVAFRTFLRTVLHELCHHLDYEVYKLAETFHTEGFYRRESSLLTQLAGPKPDTPRRTEL